MVLRESLWMMAAGLVIGIPARRAAWVDPMRALCFE